MALARTLVVEGDAYRVEARTAQGSDAAAAWRRSRDCYIEAQKILESSPTADVGLRFAILDYLEEINERLN
jgi:hypothetical protein